MVSVLAIGRKVREFNPGRGCRFARTIKSAAYLPSEGEEKPDAQILRFYGM
jgi:hypothetical protein